MAMKRRQFLQGLSAGVFGYYGLSMAEQRWRPYGSVKHAEELINSARNLIFILLEGAPSHVDTFDLKTGIDTPNLLGAQDLGGFMWPSGTMPKLAQRANQFSLLRSISAIEAVHERAVYHLLTAHRPNAALTAEIPHFASMISYQLEARRTVTDTLPTVMLIGQDPAQNGFLPIEHLALKLSEDGGIANLNHDFDRGEERLQLLDRVLAASDQVTDRRYNHVVFQKQARDMMHDTELQTLLGSDTEDDREDTMEIRFLKQCETAARVITANRGTRIFQLELSGWDHHNNIYQEGDYALPGLSRALDTGLAYLLDELSAQEGQQGSGSLLDETLIVAMGEFGRTTGRLNTSQGRDHYPYVLPAFLAGGGVKPGRIVGASNGQGSLITDRGWTQNRFMGLGDLTATLYSALGIDWTQRFTDTPSGRLFEMVDTTAGPAYAIDPLFV